MVSPLELSVIRKNTLIAEDILIKLADVARPGMTTAELDAIARLEFEKNGALSATATYGIKESVSISIDEEVVFGNVGFEKTFKAGDCVKFATGVFKDGLFTDLGFTILLQPASEDKIRLVRGSAAALCKGVEMCKSSRKLWDISNAIETELVSNELVPVKAIMGHGVGKNLHEKPSIPNTTKAPFVDYSIGIRAGEVICIEPIATTGNGESNLEGIRLLTADNMPSAHFEIPVVLSDTGCEVLAPRLYEKIKTMKFSHK